jgi:hypothetical protein
VLIFAAGVDEDLSKAFSADETSGELHFGEGRYSNVPSISVASPSSMSPIRSPQSFGPASSQRLVAGHRGSTTPCMTTTGHGAEPTLRSNDGTFCVVNDDRFGYHLRNIGTE